MTPRSATWVATGVLLASAAGAQISTSAEATGASSPSPAAVVATSEPEDPHVTALAAEIGAAIGISQDRTPMDAMERQRRGLAEIAMLQAAARNAGSSIPCSGDFPHCIWLARRALADLVTQRDIAQRNAAAAAQAEVDAAAARQAALAEETRGPPHATFAQMTPHDHFLAAQAAINLDACPAHHDCRNVDLASRHLLALRGQTAYLRTHRSAIMALGADIDSVTTDRQALADRGPEPNVRTGGAGIAAVHAYLVSHVDDPRGLQILGCAPPEDATDRWQVECRLRTRNPLGALAVARWRFIMQRGRVVSVEETGSGDE